MVISITLLGYAIGLEISKYGSLKHILQPVGVGYIYDGTDVGQGFLVSNAFLLTARAFPFVDRHQQDFRTPL